MTLTPYDIERNALHVSVTPREAKRPAKVNGRAGVELVSAASIHLEKSPPYFVKGLVHRGDLSVVYGQSGCGKTFLVLDLAHAVATGRASVFGRRVRAGRVALFALEGASGLAKRVSAIQSEFGRAENLFVYRKPLVLFQNQEMVRDVIDAVLVCEAEFVIFDTLSRTMSGANENSPEDMTAMVGVFGLIQSSTGAHVMLVHHSGKNEASGARGHSSLRAAVDIELEVTSGEGGERRVRVAKGRDDADGQEYGFRLRVVELGEDDDGDQITTCTVEPSSSPPRTKAVKISKGDAQALSWLREATEEYGEGPPFELPSGMKVTTKDKWAAIAKKRTAESSEEAIRKTISRAITNLSVAKMIGVHAPYFWVTR